MLNYYFLLDFKYFFKLINQYFRKILFLPKSLIYLLFRYFIIFNKDCKDFLLI